MRRILGLVGLLGLVVGGTALAADEQMALEPEAALASLTWLEGSWRGAIDDAGWEYETRYGSPEGGAMLSTSKTYVEGAVDSWELEHWSVAEDALVMQPYFMGSKLAAFSATLCEPNRVVVTNPANDWPQSIEYRREGETLTIVLAAFTEPGALDEASAATYILTRQ